MKLEWIARACPLCASTDDTNIFAEANIDVTKLDAFAFASRKLPELMHPRLVECPECGLLYGSPVPSLDTLASAYDKAAFDSAEEARYASVTYSAQVARIAATLPDTRGALDIGTGDGAFLEELLRIGFSDVLGIEPSTAPIEAARPDIRGRIRHEFFDPGNFSPGSFSLVTCFQTMEHVSDPLSLVRGAHTLLRPGGAFIIVVHNRKSVSARLMGLKSPIFDIEHLQLFCPATAESLLNRAEYQRINVQTLWNRYPLRYWLRLSPLPPRLKFKILLAARQSAWGGIGLSVPAGNLVCTGFKAGN